MTPRWMIVRAAVLTAVLGMLAAVSGCTAFGYRLGSSLPADIHTVHVPTFINRTAEPLLETEATQAVIRELQKNGSLGVETPERADAVLNVTLTQVRLEPVRYERDNRRTAEEYRILIHADIAFSRAKTGAVLVERTVHGEKTFEPGGDLASSKRAVLPSATDDLAHQIVKAVVEFW